VIRLSDPPTGLEQLQLAMARKLEQPVAIMPHPSATAEEWIERYGRNASRNNPESTRMIHSGPHRCLNSFRRRISRTLRLVPLEFILVEAALGSVKQP
jgi:hypothetical protein